MGKLKILAGGNSSQAKAQARGKLFEKLMAEVLRHYGYAIDRRNPSVNYAGMEIDIEGKAIITGTPLYAECKCYETEVDSPKLQKFFGQYMSRWLKDEKCQGLFIALPAINNDAKGFYRENCENNPRITIKILEEENVLSVILGSGMVADPKSLPQHLPADLGTPGDWLLLYTDKGLFWIQYMASSGKGIPDSIAIFDRCAKPLNDKTLLDYLVQLHPELNDFRKINIKNTVVSQVPNILNDAEEIVEVQGGSECFEYQFPASPQYFVGRYSVFESLDRYVNKVIRKETASRGLLFEANSGWGKSSTVLASVARLRDMGHYAFAIDSRSASSSQFILRVADYVFNKLSNKNTSLEALKDITISGFEGLIKTLLEIGNQLEKDQKVLFIFLDQFENVFFLPESLRRIRDLFLKVSDAKTNIVIGYSWKTDLIVGASEFPYRLRDDIISLSNRIPLDAFSEVETTALLNKLNEELKSQLRKDLKFFLSEFSQGYPWLLKKLCAHVKSQREKGVAQADIADSLLNVEELFQEDLRGLSPEEKDALRRIAKVAPVSVRELGEDFKPEIIQSLVNARLIVRIGDSKFDVYWDIFRDYLNTGLVPVQENYILRTSVGSVVKVIKLLVDADGILDKEELRSQAGLSEKTFYNVARDVRLLGLVIVDSERVKLKINLPKDTKGFETTLRVHFRDRLQRNRIVSRVLEALEIEGVLSVDQTANLFSSWSPYIPATSKTWQNYARNFANWMDSSDLAVFNSRRGVISRSKLGIEVREPYLLIPKRRGSIPVPLVQYKPIEKAAIRVFQALDQENSAIDWTDFKRSTISKALRTLEDLGFVSRDVQSQSKAVIRISTKFVSFVMEPELRSSLFSEAALKMNSFSAFINVLRSHAEEKRTLSQLATELKQVLGVDWKDSTAEINVKIMLDWALHTRLAPEIYTRGRKSTSTMQNEDYLQQEMPFPKT
ncbi:MAG: restriction endonuclease [Leptolyngbya sp. BL-A-14]